VDGFDDSTGEFFGTVHTPTGSLASADSAFSLSKINRRTRYDSITLSRSQRACSFPTVSLITSPSRRCPKPNHVVAYVHLPDGAT
jgi:hypothetical protein